MNIFNQRQRFPIFKKINDIVTVEIEVGYVGENVAIGNHEFKGLYDWIAYDRETGLAIVTIDDRIPQNALKIAEEERLKVIDRLEARKHSAEHQEYLRTLETIKKVNT